MKFIYGRVKNLMDGGRLSRILFILILALSLFFRFYRLSSNPPSLNWDEISHGYNAYSILKTGKDEWVFKFPLIFRAYGDYKLPLYIYFTALSEAVFGLTAFAVRLVSVLSGTGLVVLTYLITKKITKNELYSLFAAFLTAVSPWSLFLSRVAVEANLGAFLFALGMYFFISWRDSQSVKKLALTFFFWGLSLFSYNSCRILVPIWFVITFWMAARRQGLRRLALPGLIFLIFLLPMVGQFFDKSAKARFDWVSLIDQGTINRIILERKSSGLPKLFARTIFNRPTFFLFYSTKNYLSNFSPQYLFLRGGSHYQFSLPQHELLYLVTAPFLFLGIIKIFFNRNWQGKILGFWFFAAFIPSAITKDAPHVLRSILILPSPMILTALGLQLTANFLKERSRFGGKLLILVLMFSVLISFGRWWKDYFNIYPRAYSWSWQYGYSEAISFIRENYEKYNKIFFTKRYGEPHEFVLFYYPWPPDQYQNDPQKKWDYHADWYWIDRFDKFIFVNDWEVIGGVKCGVGSGRCLLVTSPGNYPEGWNKIKTIDFLDERPAFEVLEK